MLLTLTTTHSPATDLGYLLGKHPQRAQSFDVGFGQAHVFYPEASAECCTAALFVEVDALALVRRRRGQAPPDAYAYVNDRPFAASSFLAVALAQVFRSALSGRCKERPELAEAVWPWVIRLPVVNAPGDRSMVQRLFGPLGYDVSHIDAPLDTQFPDWGTGPYVDLTLTGQGRLQDVLAHLYVLIPVLDDAKHYWFGSDELEKLLKHGGGWLASHPERTWITRRYLKRTRLVDDALARLMADDDAVDESVPLDGFDGSTTAMTTEGTPTDPPPSLHRQRLAAVVSELRAHGARRVLDLGCGEGQLLSALLADPAFTQIVGVDVSAHILARAARRLGLDRMSETERARVALWQSALTYRDRRLAGFDAAAVVEVIEHLDPTRLAAFERVLFAEARPRMVVLTTPNAEYNVLYPGLVDGRLRHADHRFEWTRAELADWAGGVAERHGYQLRLEGIGTADPAVGAPSQLAVWTR
jgi:3' terminal RNA ribose 2'-O-methyltransferase Hen1